MLDISTILNNIKAEGKDRTAQSVRSCAIDMFVEAISQGWCKDNPASKTRNPKAIVKRSRLTLDHFKAIYALTKEPWQRRVLELAIITSHAGMSELSVMKFPKAGDPYLKIERIKTTERVKLPLKLTLDELGWSLEETIEKCRTQFATEFLLHHITNVGNHGFGKPMHPHRISRCFTALVKEAGIDWKGKLPATLYEVRSLSERLYRKQGINVQVLLAHKNKRSTEKYDDARGVEWRVLEL